MSFARTQAAGPTIQVPARAPAPPPTAEELASLSLAERAALALERDRGPREIPIDRAFLEASLDLGRAIRTVVAAFVPRFADWAFIDLVDDDGVPHRVEVAHADPDQAPLAAEMLSLGFGPGWATPSAQAIRDRSARLYREVSPELVLWASANERHHQVFAAMSPRSLVAVPLVARGECIGAVTLFRSKMVPPLDEAGMVVAEQIAAPAALAIDNARRFEREVAARRVAEAGAQAAAVARPKAPAKPRKAAPRKAAARKAPAKTAPARKKKVARRARR
jgi:GAF domain-containing protein